MPGYLTDYISAYNVSWLARYRPELLEDTWKFFCPDVVKPSIDNLPTNILLGGVTRTPQFRYNADDASVASFPARGYGTDLSESGVGTDPLVAQPTAFPVSTGVIAQSVKGWADASGAGAIGTKDAVFEAVIRVPAAASRIIQNSVVDGWLLNYDGTNVALIFYQGSIAKASVNCAVPIYHLAHLCVTVDRSSATGYRAYLNGALVGTANATLITSQAIDNITMFGTGCVVDTVVIYAAAWTYDSWISTTAECDALAMERYLRLARWPLLAKGTYPATVATRASAAHVERVVSGTRRLFGVSSNFLRWREFVDAGAVTRLGLQDETQATQLCRYTRSHNLWTLLRCTVPTTNALDPSNNSTADVLHEDATAASSHYVAAATTAALVSGTTYCISTFAKAINRQWLGISPDGGASVSYFNVSTGALGTKHANHVTYGIEGPYANNFYRCWITWVATANATFTILLPIAEADLDIIFNGLNQDSLCVWGSQHEVGVYPSSQIINDGVASVTRSVDNNYFPATSNLLIPGQLHCKFLCPSALPFPATVTLCGASLGGAAADSMSVQLTTTGRVQVVTAKTGGSAGLATGPNLDYRDNRVHSVDVRYANNLLQVFVDGQHGADDRSCTIAGYDRIHPTSRYDGNNHAAIPTWDVELIAEH